MAKKKWKTEVPKSIQQPASPKESISFKKLILKNKLIFTITLISIFRLWLTSDLRLIAIPSTSDDFHYTLLAYYIKSGKWLGPLDQWTLHTRVFFPIFLAFISKLKIPLLFANHFLYTISIIFGFLTIRKIIKNDWIILVGFILVLFNPMFYAGDMNRVIREGLWVPLAIIIIFSYLRFLFLEDRLFMRFLYASVSSFCLAAFYLTREDGLMIFPVLILISLFYLIFNFKAFKERYLLNISMLILPFLMVKLFLLWNLDKNYKYYKADFLVESEMDSRINFFTALSQVKQDKVIPGIPYTKDTRYRLYEQVPSFSKLLPYEDLFIRWSETTGEWSGEVHHFGIAFNSILKNAGYYESYSKLRMFYQKATVEIINALESGKLQRNTISIVPEKKVPILGNIINFLNTYFNYIFDLFKHYKLMFDGLNFALQLKDFNLFQTHEFGSVSYGSDEVISVFRDVTNNQLAFTQEQATAANIEKQENSIRNIFLQINYSIYSKITIWLFYLALLSFPILLYFSYKKRQILPSVVLFSCLAIICIRIYIIIFIGLNENANLLSVKYLALIYPFIYIFIAFNFGFLVDNNLLRFKK